VSLWFPRQRKPSKHVRVLFELGGTAGLHLPGQITHQLKGLSSDLLDDPLSKWLALLIVLNGNHSGNSVIVRPFLNSIEAIDRCGLTEDKPFCFESVSVVKDASKKPPGRPGRSDDEMQAEALIKEEWDLAREYGISKVDFARDNGYSLINFGRLLHRVDKQNKKAK
jgi:CDGSH-type Zn-finger protein